ncbi:uncharacterized protein LOC108837423 [Raphanus sativus]|uniref:Uncharacterized protein LOC108837423 n=1 Tax=Raphanus sativus TaxID=3726 RepID=A0A6J0M2S6_RAPSA|nr:uncharacterized protein LOC108837423 [Raphanus sativus]
MSGSLWVAWAHAELMKSVSFWDVKETAKGSWLWRKLLKLRPLAASFLRTEIQNGESSYFWTDDWLGTGRLIDETGELGPRYLGVPRHALVADVCESGVWQMRSRGRRVFPDTYDRIENARRPDESLGRDVIMWKHDDGIYKDQFSSARTWDQLRIRGHEVSWHHLVWFPQGVPRQAFIVWLAIRDRLSTGVRMRSWGLTQGCVFCGERDESRDHLFFACPVTYTIWTTLTAHLLGASANPDWTITVASLLRPNRPKLDTILLKMVFHSSVYLIWRERNSRRHQGPCRSTHTLIGQIDKAIRNRISSLKYVGNHKLAGLLTRWFEVYSR